MTINVGVNEHPKGERIPSSTYRNGRASPCISRTAVLPGVEMAIGTRLGEDTVIGFVAQLKINLYFKG